jgi:hypothetical protein
MDQNSRNLSLWGRLVTCGGLATRQKDAAGEVQTLLWLPCYVGRSR